MILYHGTLLDNIDSILKNGITPRGSIRKPNQGYSDPNFVYLGYAKVFGYSMIYKHPIIIECDVKRKSLYPDEDFLHIKYEDEGIDAESVIGNLELYKDEAIESLKLFGSVAHKGRIKLKQIRRIAILNKEMIENTIMRMYTPEIYTSVFDKDLRKPADNTLKDLIWNVPYSSDVIELV